MNDNTTIDVILTKCAGFVGAAVSLNYVKGSIYERIGMGISGGFASFYATPWLAAKTGLPEGLSGFLIGLFGMAICSKAWDWIQGLPIAEVWAVVLRKVGL
jgi:hypothetical protein